MARESEQPGAVESAVFRDTGAVGIEIAERRRQLLLDALRDQLLQEHDIGVHTAQRWREVGGARDDVRHVFVERRAEQADLGEAGIEGQDAKHRRIAAVRPPGHESLCATAPALPGSPAESCG